MREAQDLTALLPLLCFETLRRSCGNTLKNKRLRGLNRGLNPNAVFKTALRHRNRKILLGIWGIHLNVSRFLAEA
jgi:hypothetical protein